MTSDDLRTFASTMPRTGRSSWAVNAYFKLLEAADVIADLETQRLEPIGYALTRDGKTPLKETNYSTKEEAQFYADLQVMPIYRREHGIN